MTSKTRRQIKAETVYTPPRRRTPVRYRPRWHRGVGRLVACCGLTIILLNLVTQFTRVRLLPGGHSPLYLISGVLVASSGLWWFGWFDRQG